jgi:hypothetical protein
MRRYFGLGLISLALFAAGCARTDQQVAADVQKKITADSNIPDKQITVSAAGGVVTLSGDVSSNAARNAAANDAAQVNGVKTVVNDLKVEPTAADSSPAVSTPPPQPQADVSNNPPPAPPPRAAARPSPRTSARKSSRYSPPPDNYSDRNGDNSLRTTVPPASADTTAANSASSATPVPEPQPITVPSGTQLNIRLNDQLSSETAQVGDTFHGSISTPVMIGDTTVIPTSADVEGKVVDVKPAARFAGQSDLVIELTRLLMNGKSYPISTDRWSKEGAARGKATAAKVGGGAAVGAILGGIFGGGKGAAIGAAAGAGAGTGVAGATKGQQVILKPETVLNFKLQNSISIRPGSGNRQPVNQSQNPSNN